jgi:hypothetical protein
MNDTIFTFLGSKTMDHSKQFENHQMGFIKNLYEKKIIKFRYVLMSVYVPDKINYEGEMNVEFKTRKMKEISNQYEFELDIIYIRGKTLSNFIRALKQIKERISTFTNKVIFSQNYYSGYMGLRLKQSLSNVYLHTNLRGLPAQEELVYSDSSFLRRILLYLVLKKMGKKIISGSDSLSVVSGQYKKYLESKYNTGIKSIVVYPCTYDSDDFYTDESLRKIYREKYQIQNHQKVFIYSGSMNKYQMPADIFRFYTNIAKQDPGKSCVFIFLTLDKEKATNLSKSYRIHNLIIKSVYGTDLLGIYNASDIGVICRKKDIINRVASPTKIAEYLSTGNSVILTEGIGDYSKDLRGRKIAIVKKDIAAFLKTNLNELMGLSRLDENDIAWVKSNYSNDKIKIFNEIFYDIK